MPTLSEVSILRQKRDKYIGDIKFIENEVDQFQQADNHDGCLLEKYQAKLEEEWRWFWLIQEELDDHGEGDPTLEWQTLRTYVSLGAHLTKLILAEQPSTQSIPINPPSGELSATLNPIAIKLPDLRLPTFDGNIKKWSTFYDTSCSTIDQNPLLTDVQEFHYLRSTLQGNAAYCLDALLIKSISP